MHSSLTAIVLCMFAQAASAQCITTPSAQDTHPTAETVRAAAAPAAKAPAHAAPELIKTAAAGTRDDAPPVMREGATSRHAGADPDHPRRGGTAMLLAALALMSGIALRRYGAPPK